MRMQGYLSQVRHLRSKFESFNLLQIPRSGNTHADSLATLEPPQHRACLGLSLLKTCASLLR